MCVSGFGSWLGVPYKLLRVEPLKGGEGICGPPPLAGCRSGGLPVERGMETRAHDKAASQAMCLSQLPSVAVAAAGCSHSGACTHGCEREQ